MKNRRAGSVFINRRYVRSATLHEMIKNAYGETIVKGESPFFALNIDLPASTVDVNVHPNKLQVRFKDTAAVEHVIKEAVSGACRNIHGNISIGPKTGPEKEKGTVEMHTPPGFTQTEFFSGFSVPTLKEDQQSQPQAAHSYRLNSRQMEYSEPAVDAAEESALPDHPAVDPGPPDDAQHQWGGYRLIGCFDNAYILIEQGERLLVIDQHAAHERLLYDRFKRSTDTASQRLLTPYILTVSHEQKNLIDENMPLFNVLGFDIVPFGALEYKVGAVPSIAISASVYELINDALGEISKSGEDIVLKREGIIRAACRSAVKAGDPLRSEELSYLVDGFLKTNTMPTCPHGRPVISVITRKQLDKSFKRII